MDHFFFFQFHINSAKQFHGFRNCLEVYAHKICHIQIQIGIQHTQKLFRTTFFIGGVRFIILTVSLRIFPDPQVGITIYRHQFHLFGVIVDTCYDHRITAGARFQFSVTTIQTDQSDRRISLHHVIVTDTGIHTNLTEIKIGKIHLAQFCIDKYSANQNQQNKNLYSEQDSSASSSL